jgi:hypothetical protein
MRTFFPDLIILRPDGADNLAGPRSFPVDDSPEFGSAHALGCSFQLRRNLPLSIGTFLDKNRS